MNEVRAPGRGSLAGRLLTTYAVVFILLIGFFGLLTLDGSEAVLRRQAVESLEREVRSVRLGLAGVGDEDLAPVVASIAEALDARLTVIAIEEHEIEGRGRNARRRLDGRHRQDLAAGAGECRGGRGRGAIRRLLAHREPGKPIAGLAIRDGLGRQGEPAVDQEEVEPRSGAEQGR